MTILNPNLPKAVIVDIDGTLSDVSHRKHLVDGSNPKDWDRFYDQWGDDPVQEHIFFLVHLLRRYYPIFFVTGRPERIRKLTTDWFDHQNFRFGTDLSALYMRPDGDFRTDDVLKEEILGNYALDATAPIGGILAPWPLAGEAAW